MDPVGHRFLWAVCTNNVQVGGSMPSGECSDWDTEHSVGTQRGCGALGQLVNFGNVGSLPVATIRAVTECSIFCDFICIGIECVAMQCSVFTVIGSMHLWGLAWLHCGACAYWAALACCVFAAGVAGWYHAVIMLIGYEVRAIGPTVFGCAGSRDYVIGRQDHIRFNWDQVWACLRQWDCIGTGNPAGRDDAGHPPRCTMQCGVDWDSGHPQRWHISCRNVPSQ